jgi:hypothetical protein
MVIAGHALSEPEKRVLDQTIAFMRCSDGRTVSVYELFPARTNAQSANRRTLSRLALRGVLAACDIVLEHGCLKVAPAAGGGNQ